MEGRCGAALFGVGRIGKLHLHNIVQCNQIDVRWLVDIEAVRHVMNDAIKEHRLSSETNIATPDEIDKVLSDDKVKIVFVCVPTAFHASVIKQALNSGKHVFCEKPLALTIEDVKSCYDEAKKNDRHLLCGFNRRFDKQFNDVYKRYHSGELGDLRVLRMTSRDLGNTVEYYKHNKGGIILDMGIHDVDYICWLVGEKPVSVCAFGSMMSEMYRTVGEYDACCAILKFPCGAIAQIELSRDCGYGYDQTIQVFGTKQAVTTNNLKVSELETVLKRGTVSEPMVDCFIKRYEQSFKDELAHFLGVVNGKKECLVTGESCIVSTEVVMALTKSLETGEIITL